MAYDEDLAARIREVTETFPDISEKKMFGGIGFLHHGNMCVGVWREYLIVRVGAEAWEAALSEPLVKEFDITGRSMKGWVMVDPDALDEDDDLRNWFQRAHNFTSTLPAK